jgi:hypothetical protein
MLISLKRDAEGSELAGDIGDQVQAFTTVLDAIYRKPTEISSVGHLELATQLADFYGALPETSKAVTSSLFASRDFTASIPENCVKLLEISRKLRKECLIHCTGPWRRPRYLLLQEPELKKLCETAYQRIIHQTGLFFQGLLASGLPFYTPKLKVIAMSLLETAYALTYPTRQGDKIGIVLPKYFCNLQENFASMPEVSNEVKESIKGLLRSGLLLDRSGCLVGKPGIFENSFLCGAIKDSELPWDINETSW